MEINKYDYQDGPCTINKGSTNVGLSSANHHNIKLIISKNVGLNEDYIVYLFWNSYTISLSKKILGLAMMIDQSWCYS
jgi:hypothetical protein